MRTKKYPITLSAEDRVELEAIVNRGKHLAIIVKRANILLLLDENQGKSKTQKEIAAISHSSISTVSKMSRSYTSGGIKGALERRERKTPARKPIVTGEIEARIIQLACSAPPEGRTRWTLRLLEEKVVELEIVPSISDTTIGRTLKKLHLSHT